MSEKPTPVVGTPGGEPVPVRIESAPAAAPASPRQAQAAEESESALRSEGQRIVSLQGQAAAESETALRSHGQRLVSMVWEATQKHLALSSMFTALVVAGILGLFGRWLGSPELQLAAIVFLFGVANLITGFYFGRTNHQRVGGPGGDSAGTR